MQNPTDRGALSRAYFLATLAERLEGLPAVERAALHAAVLATRRGLEAAGQYDAALVCVLLALDRAAAEGAPVH